MLIVCRALQEIGSSVFLPADLALLGCIYRPGPRKNFYVQGWVLSQPLLPADLFRPKYMKRLIEFLFCGYGVFGLYLFYASF